MRSSQIRQVTVFFSLPLGLLQQEDALLLLLQAHLEGQGHCLDLVPDPGEPLLCQFEFLSCIGCLWPSFSILTMLFSTHFFSDSSFSAGFPSRLSVSQIALTGLGRIFP